MATDIRYTHHGREVTKSGVCSRSGKLYQVTLTLEQYERWWNCQTSRMAMIFLSPEQRLFLQQGITPDEAKPYDEVPR